MSLHNKPQSPELVAALKVHHLSTNTPSQLSDAFRLGWQARADLHRPAPAQDASLLSTNQNYDYQVSSSTAQDAEELARLRAWAEVVASLAEAYKAEIEARYPIINGRMDQRHPLEQRRYDRDMIDHDAALVVVSEIRAALSASPITEGK